MIAEITKIKKEKVSKQKKVDDIISGELESQLRLKMEELQQFNMMKMDCKDRYSTLDKSMNMAKENEIVLFETEDEKVKLSVPIQNETVWLTQDQMSELFDTARSSIAYHIGNIFKEKELERDTSVEIFDRSKNSSRPPQ